jgi:hypothetical protein
MSGRGIRLTAHHERWIHAVLTAVYVTGIAWMVLHYGINRGDGLETPWHVVETWTLRAHGAAAMATLIAFGSMLPAHVPGAWKLRRNFVSGIGMLATMLLLTATGWLLYYAADDQVRAWSSYLHMGFGAAGPLALLWHLTYRRKCARLANHEHLLRARESAAPDLRRPHPEAH